MARTGAWIAAAVVAIGLLAPAASSARLRPPPAVVTLVGEIEAGGQHAGVLELRLDGVVLATIPAAPGPFQVQLPAGSDTGMLSLEYHAPSRSSVSPATSPAMHWAARRSLRR